MSCMERCARIFPAEVFSSRGLKPKGRSRERKAGRLIILKVVQGGQRKKAKSRLSATKNDNHSITQTFKTSNSALAEISSGGPQEKTQNERKSVSKLAPANTSIKSKWNTMGLLGLSEGKLKLRSSGS